MLSWMWFWKYWAATPLLLLSPFCLLREDLVLHTWSVPVDQWTSGRHGRQELLTQSRPVPVKKLRENTTKRERGNKQREQRKERREQGPYIVSEIVLLLCSSRTCNTKPRLHCSSWFCRNNNGLNRTYIEPCCKCRLTRWQYCFTTQVLHLQFFFRHLCTWTASYNRDKEWTITLPRF